MYWTTPIQRKGQVLLQPLTQMAHQAWKYIIEILPGQLAISKLVCTIMAKKPLSGLGKPGLCTMIV